MVTSTTFLSAAQRKRNTVLTRQAMCVKYCEAHSSNHWCRGRAISITYSKYVFVAFGNHHALRHIHPTTGAEEEQ